MPEAVDLSRRRRVPEMPVSAPRGKITVWQLRALAAVHQHGVSGAFEQTGMTKAGIGRALLALERHFGRKLTQFAPGDQRRTVLNADGERLASWARPWLDELDRVREQLASEANDMLPR